ncbi:pleckstrin homology domain-containing family A member 4-like isoform X2 [Prionailurus viverrinus]|uniref:pleckstrin homology domain-containing family A member 4-like isoform X2 n=1 Tax=Prionailurus viverrinus TaxID=61388 RepID=UPI001FF4E786|nr:pleckstrin homology domain-containing family A member 4-like isoform X2 [Prionailurus viverrinus]
MQASARPPDCGSDEARAAHEGGKNCPMPATVARARGLLSKGETWRARADLLGQRQHPSDPGFPWPPPRRLHPENARTGGRPAARRGSRFCSPNPRALCLRVPWTTAACRLPGARGVWNIPTGRLSFLLSGAPSTLAPPRRRSARGTVGPAELVVSRRTPGLGGMTGPPGQPPGHTLPRAGPRLQPPPSFSLCSLHRVPRLGPRWHLWPDRARPGSAPGSSWVHRHQGRPSLLLRPGSPPGRPHRCVSGHRTGSPEFPLGVPFLPPVASDRPSPFQPLILTRRPLPLPSHSPSPKRGRAAAQDGPFAF